MIILAESELNYLSVIMSRPRTINNITCQNPECKYFLKEKGKDILKRGKNHAGHQQYYCNHCRKWFVETANTPFYHKHLSRSDILRICRHLAAKKGIRRIERITGYHRDTIARLLDDLVLHVEMVNDILLNEMKLRQFQVDEMWDTIKKCKSV